MRDGNVRPKRLSRCDGQWVLEVERLVPRGSRLLQPVPQRIEGARLIRSHLAAFSELSSLVEATEELLASESEATYEIWEGQWMDEEIVKVLSLPGESPGDSVTSQGPQQVSTGASRRAVAKLERQVEQLSERIAQADHGNSDHGGEVAERLQEMGAVLEAFGKRLTAIEDKLGLEGDPEPPAASAAAAPAGAAQGSEAKEAAAPAGAAQGSEAEEGAAPAESSQGSEAEEGAAPAESSQGSEAEEAQPAAARPDEDVEQESLEESEPAKAADQERPDKRIRVPSVVAMRQSVQALCGDGVNLTELKEPAEVGSEGFYASAIVDDQDAVVGVMLADVEATVGMAGELLMLPPAEVKEQITAGRPSEDSIDTMGEIFNTFSALLNNVKNNPHVRTRPLEPFDEEEYSWLATAKRRVDAQVSCGGIMVLAAR